MKSETQKKSSFYLNNEDFDLSTSTETGGLTGSKRVKKGETYFQLKPTILDAPKARRLKAGSTDRENFGEVISSLVSRSVLLHEGSEEYIPDVSLVFDKENNKVAVASRYLNNVSGTPDDIYEREGRRHIKISLDSPPKKPKKGVKYLGGNDEANITLRKDLAQAIAISALSGDHDVNPGNMIVFKGKDGKDHIARIDFGHAFNDLLNAPKAFGGGLGKNSSGNTIVDYFNRSKIAGFPSPDPAKLWRDYKDIIPSDELIEALKKVGHRSYKAGLEEARDNFEGLWVASDEKSRSHIENSLIAINNASGLPKIEVSGKEAINAVFDNLDDFYKQRQTDMKKAVQLMEMQRDVDKFIKGESDIKINDLKNKFKEYSEGESKITWLKTSKGKKPFKGNLEELLIKRARDLDAPEKKEEIKSEFSKDKPSAFKSFADSVKKVGNALKSKFGKNSKKDSFTETILKEREQGKNEGRER